MSAQENIAAQKIQMAWSKYLESKETCAVCMNIIGKDCCVTECGHKFCTGCLLKSVQMNGSCPLCRKELIQIDSDKDMEDEMEDMYWNGYNEGRIEAREELQSWMREQIDVATQQSYDEGIVAGRSIANEETASYLKYIRSKFRRDKLIREKINTDLNGGLLDIQQNLESDINYISKILKDKSKIIDKQKKEHIPIFEKLQDSIEEKDEEIKRLTDRLNILLRNPVVEKLYREIVL